MTTAPPEVTVRRLVVGRKPRLFGMGLLLVILAALVARGGAAPAMARVQTFSTIFLGIFLEAAPFLLLGALVAGLIEGFVDPGLAARVLPRRAVPAAPAGSLPGFVFPGCECGGGPVTRRLYRKGLPLPVGIGFLLAAPVVNPVVLFSTYAAFGWGPVLWGRLLFTIVIAAVVAALFGLAQPAEVLRPTAVMTTAASSHPAHPERPWWQRVPAALTTAADDFLDMARYLIIGSLLAAAMQTLVPQTTLLAIGSGPVVSVAVLMALAFVLSVCSTVDAFLALSFVRTFTTGSILAFLVFGPMVDIKSSLMFLGVFRPRVVVYLIVLPATLALLFGLIVNLNLGW
ncbi:MAG: permease [Caldilineales bacterium]|nr:permease [Caldilineales bacterium]